MFTVEFQTIKRSAFLTSRCITNRQHFSPIVILCVFFATICQITFLGINAGHDRIAVIAHDIIDHTDFGSRDKHGHEIVVDLIVTNVSGHQFSDHEHTPKISFDFFEPLENFFSAGEGRIFPIPSTDQVRDKPQYPLFKPPKNLV